MIIKYDGDTIEDVDGYDDNDWIVIDDDNDDVDENYVDVDFNLVRVR